MSLDATAIPARPVGAGRYVLELAGALGRRDDVDLTVVTRRRDGARWRAIGAAGVVERAPTSRPARLVWEQVALPRLIGELGADVHHAPHYTMPERSRVPTVVTIHDMTFFDHPEWHERTKAPLFRRAIRVAAERADALVCVSAMTSERLRARLDPRARVEVIPHGVDHALFRAQASPDDEDVLGSLEVTRPYVAFLGTLEPRKDVPTLVAAFDRIAVREPALSLVIAGLDGWGTKAVHDAISQARCRDRIRRVGYVPDSAVPALFRHAAAVAYPSLDEGFGLPVLEALACGAAVVTTQGTAMAEVTGDAALLVPPGHADALAQSLAALVAGGADIDGLRRRGPDVASAYTWEASAAAHTQLYRSVRG
ncbi:MAG: glycosyltransferase family 4 protein [Acidimicrobiia bacterium]|nr:glycosyltransferase family 4 protein [Acidimicrobiia bacterium]